MKPSRMQDVLDAALKLFSEKGYDKTSMRDLCRETNLTTAGLYHYITSKQDLFLKVERQSFEAFAEIFEKAKKEKDAIKRIDIFIREYLKIALDTRQTAHLIMDRNFARGEKNIVAECKQRRRKFLNEVRNLLSQIEESGLADDQIDITTAAFTLIGIVFWITLWYNPKGKIKEEELVQAVTRIFFKGYLKEGYPR
jgi:TetR/AcrR family transcriptional regulator, cholesterol catabolism regulator